MRPARPPSDVGYDALLMLLMMLPVVVRWTVSGYFPPTPRSVCAVSSWRTRPARQVHACRLLGSEVFRKQTLREIFRTYSQHRVSLIHRPHDMELNTHGCPSRLEHASQAISDYPVDDCYARSSGWDQGILLHLGSGRSQKIFSHLAALSRRRLRRKGRPGPRVAAMSDRHRGPVGRSRRYEG